MDEHTPVLVEEALIGLGLDAARAAHPADGLYVDATFGRGGHATRILARLADSARLLAIDRDPQAVADARRRFATDPRVVVVHAAFGALESLVQAHGGGRECRGILFDLGVSSPQLDQAARGFSFQQDGPLDMRMDSSSGATAAQWLAQASVAEIRDVIASLGEERFARRVAGAIADARALVPILSTAQLARIVAQAIPRREPGRNPATRTFQALRMHINDELGELRRALAAAIRVLVPGGRLAVISFHSLEDRIVKEAMRRESSPDPALARLPVLPAAHAPRLRLVGKKSRATTAETQANPRSRSALLRVAEKLDAGGV